MDWDLWALTARVLCAVRVSSSKTSGSGQAASDASGLKASGCGEGLVAPSCTRIWTCGILDLLSQQDIVYSWLGTW